MLFFFKQKTAYEMRISDWSSDVCSSDLLVQKDDRLKREDSQEKARQKAIQKELEWARSNAKGGRSKGKARLARIEELQSVDYQRRQETNEIFIPPGERLGSRSEEHTSELQSLMRISYAVFCLKKKKKQLQINHNEYKERNYTNQQ